MSETDAQKEKVCKDFNSSVDETASFLKDIFPYGYSIVQRFKKWRRKKPWPESEDVKSE